ncbi:MAG TPA: amidohydrolase family protein, partial [Solirubrobacterales bacterium]|nr:amidohydrolase family protein [Solirubrobacterales bacterium]
TARAVADAGIKATIGAPLFDVGRDAEGMRRSALASLDHLAGLGPAISPALAPHSIYMVSEKSLRWIAELGAEREVPIHTHLSETQHEVEECIATHGERPAFYLDRLGALNERTVLAHGVWLDPEELALIAERGATVVTNPVANMKLAVGGVFPHAAARAAGVAVGLGSDGAGSNDSLDLLADLKIFALIQKHAAADPTAIEAAEAWALAIGARAPLLGAGEPLTPGAAADFLLLTPGAPELAIGDLEADLVYAASGAVVDTVVVDGRALMRGGELPELAEIVVRAGERARRLGLGTAA